MNGYPVAIAAIATLAAVGMWSYRRLHRTTAWLFGLAAFGLAAGLTPWTDALASLVRTGPGITGLIAVLIAGGMGFYFEAVTKHSHHRIRTPAIAVVFGTAMLLGVASFRRLLREATTSPGRAGHAIAASMSRIQSGRAGSTVSQHQGLIVLAIGTGILCALLVAGHKVEKRHGKGRGGHAPLAITSGRPAPSRPASRPPLPAGRRGR